MRQANPRESLVMREVDSAAADATAPARLMPVAPTTRAASLGADVAQQLV
jgi:hypothetical protein